MIDRIIEISWADSLGYQIAQRSIQLNQSEIDTLHGGPADGSRSDRDALGWWGVGEKSEHHLCTRITSLLGVFILQPFRLQLKLRMNPTASRTFSPGAVQETEWYQGYASWRSLSVAAVKNGSNPDAHRVDAGPAGPGDIDIEIKEQTVIAAA